MANGTYTIRGQQYTLIGKVPTEDGRFQFELRKMSDGTEWITMGKNITPRAQLVAVNGTATVESAPVDGQAYVDMIREALKVGDYAAAINACDKGARFAPTFAVKLGDKPSTWGRARNALVTLAGQSGATVPATPEAAPSAPSVVPASASVPVPAQPATPSEAKKGNASQDALVTHGPEGTFLSGKLQPYWKVSGAISSKRGGQWTWDKARKAYRLDGSEGKPFDELRVAEWLGKLFDETDIIAEIDLTAPVPAVRSATPAGKVKVTRKAAATPTPVQPAPSAPSAGTAIVADPGPSVAEALAACGLPAHVIAASVDAARKAAGFHGAPVGPSQTATSIVVESAKVETVQPAATPAPATSGTGTRDYALPLGTPVRRSVKDLQAALSGHGAFTVTGVKTDAGKPNLLRVTGSGDWTVVDRCAGVLSAQPLVSA